MTDRRSEPDGDAVSDDAPPGPNLPLMLRDTLSQAWDSLQLVVAGAILWALAWIVPTTGYSLIGITSRWVIPATIALAALTVGPATIGLYGLAVSIRSRQSPTIAAFFGAIRDHWWRGIIWLLGHLVFLAASVLTVYFYVVMFADSWLKAIGLLWGYVIVYWLMMQLYAPALMLRDGIGPWKATRRAFWLVLDNLGYSFLVLLQIAAVVAVMIVLPPAVPGGWGLAISVMIVFFGFAAWCALLATNAVEDLLQKYEGDGGDGDGRG